MARFDWGPVLVVAFTIAVIIHGSIALNDNSFITKLGQAQRFRSPWSVSAPPSMHRLSGTSNPATRAWLYDHNKRYAIY